MTPQTALDSALRLALPAATGARLGAAVSGGGDSMALMVLLADWAKRHDAHLRVASIDHGLRPEAAQEVAQVAALAADLGVAHDRLTWSGWDGTGNLQAAARTARYDLLKGWADAHGLAHICLGHTRDDQAETVLMRLARGSGVDGLAAMAPARRQAGLSWLRPLLGVTRAELRDLLERRGLGWADDPSNDDPRFDRIRARQVLAETASLGITAQGLVDTADRMRAAREVLSAAATAAAERLVQVEAGDIVLARDPFFELPDETRWRLFAGALCQVSGAPYRPRLAALRRVQAVLADGGRATLHGCFCRADNDTLRVGRELVAVAPPAPAPGIWDARWEVACPAAAGLTIGALGATGLSERPAWRDAGLPRDTLLASPALWKGSGLHAALLLDKRSDCGANLTWGKAEFMAFLHSD